jgi:hypothetical protein
MSSYMGLRIRISRIFYVRFYLKYSEGTQNEEVKELLKMLYFLVDIIEILTL